MRGIVALLLLGLGAEAASEECHAVIRREALVKSVVNGQQVFVVAAGDVKDGCFKPVETAQLIRNLEQNAAGTLQLSEMYKKNLGDVTKLNQEYRELVGRHEAALDESVNVTEGFKQNAKDYAVLAKDYESMTAKFNELAGKYRDVALMSGSRFSVDVGAGMTSDGDGLALVGAGVNVYKTWDVKAWGILHKDYSGVMGGTSFRF